MAHARSHGNSVKALCAAQGSKFPPSKHVLALRGGFTFVQIKELPQMFSASRQGALVEADAVM